MSARASVLLVALLAFNAQAQELISNGRFDTDLSSWHVESSGSPGASWTSDNATGGTSSGSVVITGVTCGMECPSFGIYQCVQVTPSTSYVLSHHAKGTGGSVSVVWYPASDCSGAILGAAGTSFSGSTWAAYSTAAFSPAEAHSARVWADTPVAVAPATPQAWYDNISLRVAADTTAVPTLSSTQLLLMAFALVGVAVFALRFVEHGAA